MPQFNIYPALQARGIDIDVPGVMRKAQGQRTTNALRQAQLQEVQGAQGRRDQEAEKVKARRGTELAVRYLEVALAGETPEIQQRLFQEGKRRYAIDGFDISKLPETFDAAQAREWVALGKARLGGPPTAAAPRGYRNVTGGGLEFIPGGPADPATAGPLAASKRDPSGGEDGFGKGMEGQAYNTLLEYKSVVDSGQTPPADLVNRARTAQHILSKRRFLRDPEGNVLSHTPGIPQGFPTPGQQPGQAPPPGQTAPPSGGLRTEIPAGPEVDVSLPVATIRKISELLNDSGGETITGVVGTAKRLGGGLARQAGIPVSERAERLQRLLETLQGQLGPIILNEKRLSETERARLERIVGNVSPTMDEKALRSALADLVDFIVSVEER